MAEVLLSLVQDVSSIAGDLCDRPIKGDCVWLRRKVSLLSHLVEEIGEYFARRGDVDGEGSSSSSSSSSSVLASKVGIGFELGGLVMAFEAVKRFLLMGLSDNVLGKNIAIQFHYVTWQLEKVLGDLSYAYFEISDEVQEQVELVRTQLKRATEKSGIPNLNIFQEIYQILTHTQTKELTRESISRYKTLHVEDVCNVDRMDHDLEELVLLIAEVNGKSKLDAEKMTSKLMKRLEKTTDLDPSKTLTAESKAIKIEEVKKPDTPVIPEDFRCPISLELMRDPVIVSTGQTYERSFIQRWIDCGNRTCPKTQQKLQNLTLTPNYVLRSLIMQWCENNKLEQPYRSLTGHTRASDNSTGDITTISELVRNLTSTSLDEQISAAAEIRSLAKRSTDNRILLAEAGAIPALVSLLSSPDPKAQEHAVTSILNLSIYDHNKELITIAGAIVPIVEVLRRGSMEARENAAAAIFSLSLTDENKITIGSTPGAVEALVDLLETGSSRGRKDAATALFNMCIYQGNKVRALRAGILKPLLRMMRDCSSNSMVDEALTILAVLVSHQEGKVAIAKGNAIPVLIDLLRVGQRRNKENAAAVLLALCKKDCENLACIGRLGAVIPLTELSKSGTERAKRKATSLLEHLSKLKML